MSLAMPRSGAIRVGSSSALVRSAAIAPSLSPDPASALPRSKKICASAGRASAATSQQRDAFVGAVLQMRDCGARAQRLGMRRRERDQRAQRRLRTIGIACRQGAMNLLQKPDGARGKSGRSVERHAASRRGHRGFRIVRDL
jgi:hypothetical protein